MSGAHTSSTLQSSTVRSDTNPGAFASLKSRLLRQVPVQLRDKDEIAALLRLDPQTPYDDRLCVLQAGINRMVEEKRDTKLEELNVALIKLLYKPREGAPRINFSGGEGQSYSRVLLEPPKSLTTPKPEDVFKGLFGSKDENRVEHPYGVSALASGLMDFLSATLDKPINHSASNGTTPYFDLAPLYGGGGNVDRPLHDDQGQIRAKEITGQSFFPDGSPALAILLLLWMNHNYLCEKISALNDKDVDGWLSELRGANRGAQIFALAQAVNRLQFMNVVVEDVVRGLLSFPCLSPAAPLNVLVTLGTGKSENPRGPDTFYRSAEASLLYRCFSLKPSSQPETPAGAAAGVNSATSNGGPSGLSGGTEESGPVEESGEGGLEGEAAGTGFEKEETRAKIIKEATSTAAGSPKALNTHSSFEKEVCEVIKWARDVGVCTLNEFRKHLGLKPLTSFDEWNGNATVRNAAQHLYRHIDQLELFPGLHAEQPVNCDGGFALGYTLTYALLSDIVTTIRVDPVLGVSPTRPLPSWATEECKVDRSNGAFGSALSKLILRHLPQHFTYNSIQALFPLYTGKSVETLLKGKPFASHYDVRSNPREPIALKTPSSIKYVMNNPTLFQNPYEASLKLLTDGYGFMLGFDDKERHDPDQMMMLYALMPDIRSFEEYSRYFRGLVYDWLQKSKPDAPGPFDVDIAAKVIIPACTQWACERICSIPFKDRAELDEHHKRFVALYSFVFSKAAPEEGWKVREDAIKASVLLRRLIEEQLDVINTEDTYVPLSWIPRILSELWNGIEVKPPSFVSFLQRLCNASKSSVGRFSFISSLNSVQELLKSLSKLVDEEGNPVKAKEMAKLESGATQERIPGSAPQVQDPPEDIYLAPRQLYHGKKELERLRLVSTTLGLAVVSSVNFAQACIQVIDFYLDAKRENERNALIALCRSGNYDADTKMQIMGYIREAQRMEQSPRLFRIVATDTFDASKMGHSDVRIDDVVYADFATMHDTVDDPDTIQHDRLKINSIQGMGFHKCPGVSFVEVTMPEIIRAIFRMDNLRAADFGGRLTTSYNKGPPYHRIFADSKGNNTPHPQELLVNCTSIGEEPPKTNYIPPPERRYWYHYVLDFITWFAPMLTTLWKLYNIFTFVKTELPQMHMASGEFMCEPPVTIFKKWDVNTILPDLDGRPAPVEYTLEHKKPHRLSIMDIDARDMQLAVYVDNILRGQTSEFELDKNVNCGEDVKTCLDSHFSGGVVIVPPGRHTVRLEWIGKEFGQCSDSIDWGGVYSRRFKWQMEYCS